MRRTTAQIACIALPFATWAIASVVTPGYALINHVSTLLIALLVAFAALFAVTLNMPKRHGIKSGAMLAVGWTASVGLFISTMMETVILKPDGVDGRQWLPTLALSALAIVCGCEREGDAVDGDVALRGMSLALIVVGGTLAFSLLVGAASGRLSGNDIAAFTITMVAVPILFGFLTQTIRAENRERALLGAVTAAFVFAVVLNSEATYAWSPHYGQDAFNRY